MEGSGHKEERYAKVILVMVFSMLDTPILSRTAAVIRVVMHLLGVSSMQGIVVSISWNCRVNSQLSLHKSRGPAR